MRKTDDAYLLDILLEARRVRTFMSGVNRERLDDDVMLQYAVVRALSIIGEAAGKVSEERQAGLPGIPWRAVVDMRHRLVHDYRQINLDRVWVAASEGAPVLESVLAPLFVQKEDR